MNLTDNEAARDFRNCLAKMIRSGLIVRTPEYDALDAAVHAAFATPSKAARRWWDLDVAAGMWRDDARDLGR